DLLDTRVARGGERHAGDTLAVGARGAGLRHRAHFVELAVGCAGAGLGEALAHEAAGNTGLAALEAANDGDGWGDAGGRLLVERLARGVAGVVHTTRGR